MTLPRFSQSIDRAKRESTIVDDETRSIEHDPELEETDHMHDDGMVESCKCGTELTPRDIKYHDGIPICTDCVADLDNHDVLIA